ncbi:MAG: selenocysteine-specific elongation factor [Spirochaetes bacterium]|nr:MAG: selenocysteine-specific elongation factor [Spirochaetota bacterium]
MTILGLAGHVDHGKTALVKALTGVDTDRLPEEKARGMTTDLGFAALRLPDFSQDGKILEFGVIDVPGHERYIRNMVAGAWSLDLALLVVAADDGWMAQSENHARVLSAVGLPRLVLGITKIDKVEGQRSRDVLAEALERAQAIFGPERIAGACPVSVLSGQGLEDLRRLLASEGARIEASHSQGPLPKGAFLFVDRVFVKKGAGRIACGSLQGSGLSLEDELSQGPGSEPLRVKGIECLGRTLPRIAAPARVALSLGKSKGEIGRGDLLFKLDNGPREVFSNREFIFKVETLPSSLSSVDSGSEALKKGGEIEVAVGTAWRIGRLVPLGKGPWHRFVCVDELAFPASRPLVLIRHGGAEILGRAWAIFQGKTDRMRRRKLASLLEGQEKAAPNQVALLLRNAFYPARAPAPTPRVAEPGPNHEASIPASLEPSLRTAEKTLSEAGRNCLEYQSAAQARSPSAYSAPRLPPRKDMDTLCALGLAVPLDRNLFIHRDVYTALVSQTLKGKNQGDKIEIGEAKERTGFSRKFVLPFLNRMERDGYVKRTGDSRIMLGKRPEPKPRQG